MLSEDTKVLEFNQYQNITIHYSEDLECIIEKADKSKKILKIHLQQKLADTFHQVFQWLKYQWSMENKHDVYRDKDSMEKYCESLGEQATKIINFKKKKNETINKRAVRIIWKFKNLLHL